MGEEVERSSRRMLMAPLAEIELSDHAGVRVVAVEGELDISNVGELEQMTLTMPNDTLGLVLDLTSATYIDSATLGLLFKLRRALQRRRQALRVVCAPGSSAQRVLELTGFDRERTHADRDTAIESIRSGAPAEGQEAATEDRSAAIRAQHVEDGSETPGPIAG